MGNCYARHISGTPPALCSLFGSFWLLFHCVTCSHSPLIHAVYPPSLTCTRATRRRLTAADDFHDAHFFQLFVTHTHTLARTRKWGTCSIRKRYFLVNIGWMVCQQCQEIEINKETQSLLCSHWCLHSVALNVNGWAQCAYQASDFSHLF